MRGRQQILLLPAFVLLGIATCFETRLCAQPIESSEPIGGVTFDPPRPATIRHRGGQLIRGDLIGISEELIHFRVGNGKQFHYPLKDIRSIATKDGDFKYASAYDTYRKIVENARELEGVTIDAAANVAGTGMAVPLPRPPAPPLPVVHEAPESRQLVEVDEAMERNNEVVVVPPIPVAQPQVQQGGVSRQPIYETGAFKIGFIAVCLVVIGLWWRNRVG